MLYTELDAMTTIACRPLIALATSIVIAGAVCQQQIDYSGFLILRLDVLWPNFLNPDFCTKFQEEVLKNVSFFGNTLTSQKSS